MKVNIKDSEAPCEKVLSVAVSKELIHEEYDDFFKRLARDARVPGFRPGKAPREVLETHFREEAREKVLERLISRSFREAVGEKQIDFLGRPTIRGIEFTREKLAYEALIEVPPAIRLKKYKGLRAVKAPVEVKAEEVDKALEEVRNSLAKFVSVEDRPAQMGDFLIADYRCAVGGKEVEKRTDDWFELREDEFLKGFSPQLAGARTGEDREVRIQFPEKFGRREWAGKEGIFFLKIKEIKAKKLHALDDDLAKETGEFETLADLKRHLEKRIEDQKGRDVEVEFENALLAGLIKENPFEVPKGVVERRRAALLQSTIESLYKRGMKQELIESEIPSLAEKLGAEAEREVRISFLLDEIAKREKLELAEPDFEAQYRQAALRHRQSEEAVRKFYSEHPDAKESLRVQILSEKVIQFIKTHAEIQ